MLGINPEDVIRVVKSIQTQLIVIGIILLAAILITIFVNKKTVKNVATKKMVRSQTWIVALIASFAAIASMLYGPLNTIVTSATTPKFTITQASIDKASKLALDIQREGIVMMENSDKTLPLSSDSKVNVFGWASTNPIYGGTGSGSMNARYAKVSLLEGLKEAGLSYNDDLAKFYAKYRSERPVVGMMGQDWSLPEPPVNTYSSSLLDKAKSYSDTAVVVIGRSGGEGADLPTNMGDVKISPVGTKLKQGLMGSPLGSNYINNSKDYADFKAGDSYLQLSQTEKNLMDYVNKNFKKVVLVYNGANDLNLSFISQYPNIKSVLWCPPAGQTGFQALGEVIAGKANPSGRTTDTFVKDFTKTPWWNNFGAFQYDNMNEFSYDGWGGAHYVPTYVKYVEGIYVGYRYYETAATEGSINYNDVVQYPFGYGLSYTTFKQTMSDPKVSGTKVSFDVTVKNTGEKAGKDTVEVYYNPPYTNGAIEKASVNLIRFSKTKELKPGESQKVQISFDESEMASYDYKNAKAYVLESGKYGISINKDSHEKIESHDVTVDKTITYKGGKTRVLDKKSASNQFDTSAGDVTYLSRKDGFANFKAATAKPTSNKMPEESKKLFVGAKYKAPDEKATMPTTGAKNGVSLYQLYGKKYDDPLWNKLLDQISVDDMNNLIAMAGYNNAEISSIKKPRQNDVDGPAALNNNFTGEGSIGFPASTTVANTFNEELASEYGKIIGEMAQEMRVTGWYAPAMNTHRSAFGGRNFEYFSEDGQLAGTIAAAQIAGAKSKGVYGFMKHFALNDQETNRMNMLCTWSNEQAIREIYLKPFQLSAVKGGATAVMSSFNYIGPRWSASNSNLLNKVLRGEWGFRGFVETDYFGGGNMIGDEAIRGGDDAMLGTTKTSNYITNTNDPATVKYMRTATHDILYTAVNSWLYKDGQPSMDTSTWKNTFRIAAIVVAVLVVLLEILAFRRFFRRRKAAKAEAAETEPSKE